MERLKRKICNDNWKAACEQDRDNVGLPDSYTWIQSLFYYLKNGHHAKSAEKYNPQWYLEVNKKILPDHPIWRTTWRDNEFFWFDGFIHGIWPWQEIR